MTAIDARHGAAGRAPSATAQPVRLLIVDDSAVARAMLSRMIGPDPGFEIAATVSGADAALAFLAREQVDTVLLDIEMPGLDGLTALPRILAASAGAHVLIVSSTTSAGAAATMRALTLGATDTLAKPAAGDSARFADALVDRLRRMGHAPRRAGPAPRDPPLALRALSGAAVACLAIGASTGGPRALADLLSALPPGFDAPILVTQHLPAAFMPFFAAQLEEVSHRPARVAAAGDRLARGAVLIAPGHAHLTVHRPAGGGGVRVALEEGRTDSGCLPSVDPMLASVGRVFGPAGLGVVLTGMGRDGTAGGRVLVEAGADLLVQDRGSSVVWGMPGAAAAAGLAAAAMHPARLARLIAERGAA